MATRRRDAPPEDPFAAIGCIDVVPIGQGGSSLVYRARQEAFDRLIALKVLSMPLTDERARRRFERELALAGRLTGHPNVVTVFASGFFGDGRAYVEMEYCPGGSLSDRLAAQGPLPVRDVVGIGVKIAGVLELARMAGIVHRDVKPANLLVTRFGEPALADFGIAIVSGEMTGTTQALTPVHAAPEVLESRGAGPPADQWSLGSTLHTLLAGRAPFASDEEEGLLAGMLRILNDSVPVIPRPDVPETLRSVLARAMKKLPEERWSSAAELGAALQEVERREGWPVTTMPTEEVSEVRYPSVADGGGVGVVGAGGGGAGDVDPRVTHSVPSSPPTPPVRDGTIWPRPEPPGSPPSEGNTVRWDRRGGSRPAASPVHGSPGPGPGGWPAPFVPPDLVPGETTQYWNRARRTPVDNLPPPPAERRSHLKLWAAVGAAAVVVIALVTAVVVTRSPAHAHISRNTVTPPSNPQPQRYEPLDLTVQNESATTATLRWKDPSNGLYPFVAQVVGSHRVQQTNTSTQTVIAGLDATKFYCFVVGAVYAPGSPPAFAPPVCIRGATATSTTTSPPRASGSAPPPSG